MVISHNIPAGGAPSGWPTASSRLMVSMYDYLTSSNTVKCCIGHPNPAKINCSGKKIFYKLGNEKGGNIQEPQSH